MRCSDETEDIALKEKESGAVQGCEGCGPLADRTHMDARLWLSHSGLAELSCIGQTRQRAMGLCCYSPRSGTDRRFRSSC